MPRRSAAPGRRVLSQSSPTASFTAECLCIVSTSIITCQASSRADCPAVSNETLEVAAAAAEQLQVYSETADGLKTVLHLLWVPGAQRELLLQTHLLLLRLLADPSFLISTPERSLEVYKRLCRALTVLVGKGAGEGRGEMSQRDQADLLPTFVAVSSRSLALGSLPACAALLATARTSVGEGVFTIGHDASSYVLLISRLISGPPVMTDDVEVAAASLEAVARSSVVEQLVCSLLRSGLHDDDGDGNVGGAEGQSAAGASSPPAPEQQRAKAKSAGRGCSTRCSCHVLNLLTLLQRLVSAFDASGLFDNKADFSDNELEGGSESGANGEHSDDAAEADPREAAERRALRRSVAAARQILSGPCLQYGTAAHVVAQLAAADGGTRYGLAEADLLPPLLVDAKDPPAAGGASGGAKGGRKARAAAAQEEAGDQRVELQHMGIATAMRLWCWGLGRTPQVPLTTLPRAAVHALAMRSLALAVRSAAEHAARRQRRREEEAAAAAAAAAAPATGKAAGVMSQREARQRRQQAERTAGGAAATGVAGRSGGGNVAAAASAAAAAAPAPPAPLPSGERRLLAMAAAAPPPRYLIPDTSCARTAMEALRCFALSAPRPPILQNPNWCRDIDESGGASPAIRAQLDRWWAAAVPAMHMVVTHSAAGTCSTGPAISFLVLQEFMPLAPAWARHGLPPTAPTNIAAALGAGWLPLLERAIRSDSSIAWLQQKYSDIFLMPFNDADLLMWLLAYGEPSEAAALMATGAKLVTQVGRERLEWRARGGGSAGGAAAGGESDDDGERGSDSDCSGSSSDSDEGCWGIMNCGALHNLPLKQLLKMTAATIVMRRNDQSAPSQPPSQAAAAPAKGDSGEEQRLATGPGAHRPDDGDEPSPDRPDSDSGSDSEYGSVTSGEHSSYYSSSEEPDNEPPVWHPTPARQLLVLTVHSLCLWLPRIASLAADCLLQGPLGAAAHAVAPLALVLAAWVPPLLHAAAAGAEQRRSDGTGGPAPTGAASPHQEAEEAGADGCRGRQGGGGVDKVGCSGRGGDVGGSAGAEELCGGGGDGGGGTDSVERGGGGDGGCSWPQQLLEQLDVAWLLPTLAEYLMRLEDRFSIFGDQYGCAGPDEQAALDNTLSALELVCAAFPGRIGSLHAAGRLPPLLTLEHLCPDNAGLPEAVAAQRRRLAAALAAEGRRGGGGGEAGAAKRPRLAAGGPGVGEGVVLGEGRGALPDGPCMLGDMELPVSAREVGELLASVCDAELTGLLRTCSNPQCTNLAGDSEAEVGLKRCGGCVVAVYCGAECQVAHWRAGHKVECPGRRRGVD